MNKDHRMLILREEEVDLSSQVYRKYDKRIRSKSLGVFTSGFYGKNQAEICKLFNDKDIFVPDGKIVNVMDEVHLLYRNLGYYFILKALKEKNIAKDFGGALNRIEMYGEICNDSFMKLMREGKYFRWCRPLTDLEKIASGETCKPYELVNKALESTNSIRTQMLQIRPSNIVIFNSVRESNIVVKTNETKVVEQLSLFDNVSRIRK